jgi:FkbM family methyltransferase
MNTEFMRELKEKIESSRDNDWQDNWDFRRFGTLQSRTLTTRAKSSIKSFLQKIGLRANHTLADILAHEAQLQWLYDHLEDDESRHLLVDLMAYRALGHRKVKLPLNSPAYWLHLNALERNAESGDHLELDFRNWKLNRYNLSDEGYPIQVYARASGVFTQLILQQYRCVTADHCIEVGAGETVIDAGGCYGDTALYFAHKAGPTGRVYSCEFMPNNIRIFRSNLALNPTLAATIEIIPNPLWSTSDEKLFVEGVGPAAHVTPIPRSGSATQVETLRIDDLAQRESLERVDFIKMDIEGAELEALKGAESVIHRDRPKLAISVYHKLHDFWTIPRWIDSLGLGYRFYLRHFTIHGEETVLFAEAVH